MFFRRVPSPTLSLLFGGGYARVGKDTPRTIKIKLRKSSPTLM
ncbi:MAG: hypothetical protein NZ455_06810 [Bacteroidia bacterium]|nr:hypothetical protein [Bacteroidia bacterium]MDW8345538.1 hypothetical protein [Bacteroidia bacterium]